MTDLYTFRDAVVADLRPGFDPKVKIGTHVGAFTMADVEAYAVEAPCIKVAILSGKDLLDSDADLNAKVAAYIITKTGQAGTYDKQLLLLMSQLFGMAKGTQLANSVDASRPQSIEVTNLTSRATGAEGIGLGSVSWTQIVPITIPDPDAGLHPFLLLYATLNFPDGELVATDVVNLPQG